MSKDLPAQPLTFWARLMAPITKAFAKPIEKPERPAHGADWARSQGANNPYPAGVSMAAFAQHGYVYAAVSRASQDLAALPVKLIRGRGESSEIIEEHPFLDLMDQPSTYKDGFSFREQLIVDLMLSGGCYVLLAGATDVPTSLFRLHPEQTKIITDPIVGIKGFEFSDSGAVVEYPIDRVVYAQSASWGAGVNALYGVGGIQPLQREISADISAQKLASDAAKKGRPDILISPADEADIWDYEQRKAILDAYKGMSSEGGAMVLSGQVKIEPLQVTPRDLEFQAVRDYTRQAISAVFGVPPSVLGDNSANFAVSRQQAQNYWEVQTKRGKRLSFLLTQIAKRFDKDLRVEIDYSGVEALQDIRDAQLDRITKHILNGMDAGDAYMYEGMQDAPIVPIDERETPAEDIGDEEGQNVRALELILRTINKGNMRATDVSNFPKQGDDLEVSLDNSQYKIFDADYAKDIQDNWPQIWAEGGNIEGNDQFRRLTPIVERDDKTPQTDTEEMAIRLREAWAARHEGDFRLAGVVAQIKWYVVGDRGQRYMKDVIEQEKAKLTAKKERSDLWFGWVQKAQKPAENAIERAIYPYLREALKRYKDRVRDYVVVRKDGSAKVTKAVLDWASLLAMSEEMQILQKQLGRQWLSVWTLTGNDALDDVYARLGKPRPLDLVFGSREAAVSAYDLSSYQISQTTAEKIKKIVEQGLLNGDSVEEIAKALDQRAIFGRERARLIARTESTKAVNMATNEAYNTAANEGINIRKEWLSSRDELVRDTHVELDGQIVGVNDEFTVPSTGNKAESPASFGIASEDINCRCTLIPVIGE